VLEFLKSADRGLFLFLNGMHNSFFDFVMYWASDRFIWIPFYLVLLYVIIKAFGKKTFLALFLVAAMITISDQVSSTLVKNEVQRLRPCHTPEIESRVHLVNGYCGGSYGFFSSHASNTWALAVFLILVFRRSGGNAQSVFKNDKKLRLFFATLICYAAVVSYSRVYLGSHYPGDVIAGIAFGSLLSFIFAHIFFRFQKK